MANGPLDLNLVIGEVKTELLQMEFDVDDFDGQGHKIGTHREHVVPGNGIDQLSVAIGTAIYNVLKNQVLVQVNTTTPVPATPGVFPGTGQGVVQ